MVLTFTPTNLSVKSIRFCTMRNFLLYGISKHNYCYYRNLSNTTYEKKIISISYIHVMTFRRMLISYVTLDHTLYSINYGINQHIKSQFTNPSYRTELTCMLIFHWCIQCSNSKGRPEEVKRRRIQTCFLINSPLLLH